MSRALFVVRSPADKLRITSLLAKVPIGTRVEFKASKRSLPQNSKLWACLTDVAQQVEWHGMKLRADDWKLIFLDALHREIRAVPNLDGTGFVNLGRSSSDLSKEEMSDVIELIFKFGAEHNVTFHDPAERAA